AGHVLGQAGRQPGGARHVVGLAAQGVEHAPDHVLDRVRIDARALYGRVHHRSGQVQRMDLRQRAVAPAGGGADGFDDIGLRHQMRSLRVSNACVISAARRSVKGWMPGSVMIMNSPASSPANAMPATYSADWFLSQYWATEAGASRWPPYLSWRVRKLVQSWVATGPGQSRETCTPQPSRSRRRQSVMPISACL